MTKFDRAGGSIREAGVSGLDSLNQFIEQAAQVGTHHSDGVFTLDVDRAGDKVQRFQLVDPYLYAAHLVSVAVLGGSQKLRYSKSATQLSYVFDGEHFPAEQLEHLSQGLLAGFTGERRLQELAIAVSGARATAPSRLTFESVSSDGIGASMQYLGETRTVQRVTGGFPGNRLVLDYPVTWKRLLGRFDSTCPEVDVLKRFCSRAPLVIQSDLEQITSQDFVTEGFVAWKGFQGDSVDPGIPVPRQGGGYCASVGWRQPFSAVIALTNPYYAESIGLMIVLNGVAFRREKVLACPFACGVVHITHLNKNISHTDLAEDQAYADMLDCLRAKVDELWREVAESNVSLSDSYRPRVVDYLLRRFPAADRPLSIRRFLVRMELERELESTNRGYQLLDEARALDEHGDREQPVLIRTKVLDGAGRLLVAGYPYRFNKGSARLSKLYARAFRELRGSPNPAAQELESIISVLVGAKVEFRHPVTDDWQRFRATLVAMVAGDLELCRGLLLDMDQSFAWRWYLAGELDGDLECYRKATRLAAGSAFLWNEAAAACRHHGQLPEAIKCRIRAVDCLPNDEQYFINRLARELYGKATFAGWVKWSVLAQFRPTEAPRVTDLARTFAFDGMLAGNAATELEQFLPRSREYAYLEHVLRWAWKSRRTVSRQAGLSFLARSLLLRSLEASSNALSLVELKI